MWFGVFVENVAKIEMGVSDLRIPGGNHMHIDVKGCVHNENGIEGL